MVRRLDTSMIDGEDTPGPRHTPLVNKIVDRVLHKRERCEKHCHCVTEMRVKVSAMFYLLLACLAYFIPREVYGWMHAREIAAARAPTSNAERMGSDRVPEPPTPLRGP